jgi:hypothetical protein
MKKWFIVIGVIVVVIATGAVIFMMQSTAGVKVINLEKDVTGRSVSVNIYKGEYYLHDFKVNSLITIKTPPQMAIWVEDLQGKHLQTLYATSKIVNQNWSKAPSDNAQKGQIKREEALPYWNHVKTDGQNILDAVTTATPKGDTAINTELSIKEEKFVVKAEVNMSTDFNKFYPKDAKPGDAGYSGGEYGSGQPAVVYAVTVDTAAANTFELVPIGHSSPDGNDGKLVEDLSGLDTAKDIISRITFTMK